MPSWLWAVIVVALVVIIVLVAALARRRRTATLQERFGPEYDRTVAQSDNQRSAEAELRQRAKNREQLDIRPLPEGERVRFGEQWRMVQGEFVDHPVEALAAADGLVADVMRERGYPMDDFESNAELVSVDHPHVVDNFRVAHEINGRAQMQHADTEELRTAMLRYRSLFDELLRDDYQHDYAETSGGNAR